MTAMRTYMLICLLVAGAFCRADSTGNETISTSEYRAELDRLSEATKELDSSGRPTPAALHNLPQSWHIQTDQGDFEVSAEGLSRDVRRYEGSHDYPSATAIVTRIRGLRAELEGFEKPAADFSAQRADLNSILARPEFRNVHGPTWLDRLKGWLLGLLLRALGRMFRSVAIPTVGRFFVYGLMAIAVLALGYLAYRNLVWGTDFRSVTPADLPISAKEWAVWLAEAREAAAGGNWRDGIRLAYWAGISFLERQGSWKPDRARTPREYLRLLPSSSGHRETLTFLTRTFEVAWYGKRDANERTFSETLAALENLGCR